MERLRRVIETLEVFYKTEISNLEKASFLMAETIRSGNKIMWCGNGGSAAQAMHFSTELMARYKETRNPLPSLALPADAVLLTATANDFGFEHAFSRQVEGLGKEGDLLVAITTSGSSKNVVNAIKVAKSKKIKVILLTGERGSEFEEEVDILIKVPSVETPIIQECHEIIGHILVEGIEKNLGGF